LLSYLTRKYKVLSDDIYQLTTEQIHGAVYSVGPQMHVSK